MNCVWEILLHARESGFLLSELRFSESRNPSPYMESAFPLLNQEKIESREIELNPLYRFGAELSPMLKDPGLRGQRSVLFDAFFHLLALWDLRSSYTREEFLASRLHAELREGALRFLREDFSLFSLSEQKLLLYGLLSLEKGAEALGIFQRALGSFYPESLLYLRAEEGELILSLGVPENERERRRFSLLRKLFLPLYIELVLFWDRHFGILGVAESLRIGECVLF